MVFAWRRSRARAVTDRRKPSHRGNNLKVPAGHFHESSTLEEESIGHPRGFQWDPKATDPQGPKAGFLGPKSRGRRRLRLAIPPPYPGAGGMHRIRLKKKKKNKTKSRT
jgi:hypothetical protein